ncbi:replication initiation protein [Permianibacter sp. IMCC34836]|nr:replication initiation protein [Permianibacter fluminis]
MCCGSLLILTAMPAIAVDATSVCHGSAEHGRLERGWQLPRSGDNFSAYSGIGAMLGRNYVHSQVYAVVLAAYASLASQQPTIQFVYGETGKREGGEFSPHKTHQNGLSVDFMVPVRDEKGRSVPLPTGVSNQFGYKIEFSKAGKYEDLSIDFDAMAEHLLAIKQAAAERGVGIRRVIFDNDLQALLFRSARGKGLAQQLPFSKKKPWVRHDEHYHIDFELPCAK